MHTFQRYLLRASLVLLPFLAGTLPAVSGEAPQQWVKLDVPYVPTPPVTIAAMLEIASVGPNDILYDLGSGDGRIPITAVRDRGVKKAVGIELNPARIVDAKENARIVGVTDKVSFIEGDVFKVDFKAATVVTMYLFDNVNLRLRPRILDELKPGMRGVSHQFHMSSWTPDDKVMVQNKVPVYLWIVPAKVDGVWEEKSAIRRSSFTSVSHFSSSLARPRRGMRAVRSS